MARGRDAVRMHEIATDIAAALLAVVAVATFAAMAWAARQVDGRPHGTHRPHLHLHLPRPHARRTHRRHHG